MIFQFIFDVRITVVVLLCGFFSGQQLGEPGFFFGLLLILDQFLEKILEFFVCRRFLARSQQSQNSDLDKMLSMALEATIAFSAPHFLDIRFGRRMPNNPNQGSSSIHDGCPDQHVVVCL